MEFKTIECWAFAWANGSQNLSVSSIIYRRRKDCQSQIEQVFGIP